MPASAARSTRAAPALPPPQRVLSIAQVEAAHPGVKGRLRGWIKKADSRDPYFLPLRLCVIRVGRSVLIDEARFSEFLRQRAACPPAPPRNP